jgi:hypothetical protein
MRNEPFHGCWKLNVPASKLPFAAPRSVLLRIEVGAESVKIIESSLSAEGIPETVNIEAKFDNEVHGVIGSGIADGFAIRRVNTGRWETRGFKAGQIVFSAILAMSEDGLSFREDGETTLADGSRAGVSLLYEQHEKNDSTST